MSNPVTTDPANNNRESADRASHPGTDDDRVLLILAVDHRNSFEHDLYGLKGTVPSAGGPDQR